MKKVVASLAVMGAIILPVSASVLFSDDFNAYADGPLTTVSGGVWANHSGTVGQVDVLSHAVLLTENESEDVNALIGGGPYTTGVLYYGLTVNFSELPTRPDGGYFAHFKDASTGFRARLFVTTIDAAPGTYRLGINNGSTPVSAIFPLDLTLNTYHQAIVRYDLGAVSTTLWVDPQWDTDPSVVATDVVTANDVVAIALRQSRTTGNSMGTLLADNVKVGTSFYDVIPEPTGLLPLGLLGLLAARHLRRRA